MQSENAAEQAKGGEDRAKAQTAEVETAAQAGATQAEAVAAEAQADAQTGVESAAEEGGQAQTEAAAVYAEATGGEQADAKDDDIARPETEGTESEPAADAGAAGGEEFPTAADAGGEEATAFDAEHDEAGGGEPGGELDGATESGPGSEQDELRRSIRDGRRLVDQELTEALPVELGRLQAAVSRATAAIGASVARQIGRVGSAGEAHSGAVRSAFAAARGRLGSAIGGARGGVRSGGQAGQSQLGTWQGQASGRAHAQVTSKAERTRALGAQFAGQGQAAAAQTTSRVSGDINAAAGQVQGQAGRGGGGSNEAAASGNAKVAGRVSGDTASKVRSEGAQVVGGVQREGAKVGQTFQQKGGEAAAQIQSQLPGALSETRSIASSAQTSVGRAAASGLGALGKLEQATGQGLAGQQAGTLGRISSTVAATRAQLAQVATQAQAAVRDQGAAAGQALTATVGQLRARVRRALVQREQAAEVADGFKGELRGQSSGAIAGLGGTARQGAAASAQGADAAVRGLAQEEGGARSQAAASTGRAAHQAGATSRGVGRQTRMLASRAMSTGSRVLTAFDTKLDSAVGKVDSTLAQGLGDVQGQMSDHAGKAASRAGEAPGKSAGKIDEGKARVDSAADTKESESGGGFWGWAGRAVKAVGNWLKKAWDFVTNLLTDPGFWVSLVVGVALMAFAVATFGTGLAALAIAGTVVGAISGGAGQIVTNVTQGKPWNEGLLGAVALGGLGGLVFGPLGGRVAGAIGSRLASTALGRGVSALGSRVASSALGRGIGAMAQGIGRGVGAVAGGISRGLGAAARGIGRGLSAAARGIGAGLTRVGQRAKDVWKKITGKGGKKTPEAGVRASARGANGHMVKVTDRGKIMVCSICGEIETVYGRELRSNPDLMKELERIKKLDPDDQLIPAVRLQEHLERMTGGPIRTPSPALPGDPYHPEQVRDRRVKREEHYGPGEVPPSERSYDPSPKHKEGKGGWGSPMDLDPAAAQEVLSAGYQHGKQIYGFKNGKLYEFQPDNIGNYHGYLVPGRQVPSAYLRQLRDRGLISNAEYKKMTQQSSLP